MFQDNNYIILQQYDMKIASLFVVLFITFVSKRIFHNETNKNNDLLYINSKNFFLECDLITIRQLLFFVRSNRKVHHDITLMILMHDMVVL